MRRSVAFTPLRYTHDSEARMATEQAQTPNVVEQGIMSPSERQELVRLRTYRRRHQMRESISFGAFGGGVMLAGFGPLAAATGMLLGGLAGYLVERRIYAAGATLRS
jgi:hypothetical protein